MQELIVLEAKTGEQTRLIATKADLILQQEGTMLLALDSLKVEFQSQLQQHTTLLQDSIKEMGNEVEKKVEKVGSEVSTTLANLFKQFFDAHEKNKDEKDGEDAQEVRKPPLASCMTAVLIYMPTQLQMLRSIDGKPIKTTAMVDIIIYRIAINDIHRTTEDIGSFTTRDARTA
jgi:hypothetical protein